jgi:hypothetical protein
VTDIIDQVTGLSGTGSGTGTGSSSSTGIVLSAPEIAVNSAYREILLRDPEVTGMAWWKSQIESGTMEISKLPLTIACAAKESAGSEGTNAKAWLTRTGKNCGGGSTATGSTTGTGAATGTGKVLTMYPLFQWTCLQYDFPVCTEGMLGQKRTAHMSYNG